MRVRNLLSGRHGGFERRYRDVLCIGQMTHEIKIGTDRVPDGAILALLAQARGACGKYLRAIGEAQPRDGSLRERFNLTGFEDA